MRAWQRSWYWYDWAAASFVTTVSTVLVGPYLTAVAKAAACPGASSSTSCPHNLSVLGIPVSPGSLVPYTVTFSTILSAFLLLAVGAIADRSSRPARLLGAFAWPGAAACGLLCLVSGTQWVLGAILLIVANQFLGASLVVYNALLVRISTISERDRVSSRGWAYGYAGGGLLLILDLIFVLGHASFGLSTASAVRLAFFIAGVWWALFTLIPVCGLHEVRRPVAEADGARTVENGVNSSTSRELAISNPDAPRDATAHPVSQPATHPVRSGSALGQLRATFADARRYPDTLRFLLAYLFYNDGIQTVIVSASIFGKEELGLSESQLIITILIVQFVGIAGALGFARVAGRTGAQRAVIWSLILWTVVVVGAYFLPAHRFAMWSALGVGIGLVLGGSQALSRSLFSTLIPPDKESEYFSLYQAMERGTSWFGTLTFGLVHQITGSYRLSIVALIVFFGVGGMLLRTVDVERGRRRVDSSLPTPEATA